jgi:hypothetical protein
VFGNAALVIEDPYIDVTGGSGVFEEFGPVAVARPHHEASWGAIKALFR